MSSKVTHTYNDHLITRQNRAEKEFLAAFEAEKPTLENAHVLVNPYFINQLLRLSIHLPVINHEAFAELSFPAEKNILRNCQSANGPCLLYNNTDSASL